MKQKNILTIALIFILAPLLVFAQTTEQSILNDIINLIGGWKGLTSFAAALAIVQILIKLLNSKLSDDLLKKVKPEHKFLIIQFLSIIVAYLTLVTTGVSGVEAVFKTLAMPVFVEFLHKLYKQFIEKKEVTIGTIRS